MGRLGNGTYVLGLPVSCFMSWQYISSRSSPWVSPSASSACSSSSSALLAAGTSEVTELVVGFARSRSLSPMTRWIALKVRTASL